MTTWLVGREIFFFLNLKIVFQILGIIFNSAILFRLTNMMVNAE